MTTDNTQELDGIFDKMGYTKNTDFRKDAIRLITDWHNKQVKNAVATAEDNLDQYWNKELDKQVEEAMAKFHLKKGVKYDVKASDSVIVITPTNKINESKAKE